MGWDGVARRRVRGLTGAKAGALVSGPEDKCTPRDAPVGRQDTWITDDHGCDLTQKKSRTHTAQWCVTVESHQRRNRGRGVVARLRSLMGG